ncbi:MAG: M48 family metalloprotease [Planctomycetota bacterium]|jgi:predicted Zn-dependent protease|nr:M48 family metalloprotease [Planctomycetota bacterium]MDP7248020.1 M48 family metalloprotease [Planctomycetota bacterium]
MPRIILSLLLIVPAAQAQKFDFGSLLKKAIEKPENKKPASTNARNAPSQEDALGMSIVDLLRTSGSVNYQQEATMGETIALEALTKFGPVVQDKNLLAYVSMVGNVVARASDRPHTPYFFAVCQNNDPNAFAVPGGYVFITTGLLKLVANEEELAGVLGHEIAHITQQHAIKMVRSAKFKAAAAQGLLFALTKDKAPQKQENYASIIGGFTDVMESGYGRKHETESDKLGVLYAYRAGYGVHGLRNFLATLARTEQSNPAFSFFKTHKDTGKRVRDLDKEIQKEGYMASTLNPNLSGRFQTFVKARLR